jgi:hypothetical protein
MWGCLSQCGVGDLGMRTCQLGLDNWAVWISVFWQSRLGNPVRSTWQNNQREK